MQHCKNLDNATENILNYHHEIILSQKKIDYALQELLKGEKESKAETSDEFRNKIIELRKKTNEYMLKVNQYEIKIIKKSSKKRKIIFYKRDLNFFLRKNLKKKTFYINYV